MCHTSHKGKEKCKLSTKKNEEVTFVFHTKPVVVFFAYFHKKIFRPFILTTTSEVKIIQVFTYLAESMEIGLH